MADRTIPELLEALAGYAERKGDEMISLALWDDHSGHLEDGHGKHVAGSDFVSIDELFEVLANG
jgi:hypothetical protein